MTTHKQRKMPKPSRLFGAGCGSAAALLAVHLLAACSADGPAVAPAAPSLAVRIAVDALPWQAGVTTVTRTDPDPLDPLASATETLDALKDATPAFMVYSTSLDDGSFTPLHWDSATELWSYDKTILWPENQVPTSVTIYAYAPTTGNPATDATAPDDDTPGKGITLNTDGTLTFTTPASFAGDVDLLWARASNANDETTVTAVGVVHLNFQHALARLSFGHVTNNFGHDITLQSVTVTGNPYLSGTLDLRHGDSEGTWTPTTSAPPASQTRTYDADTNLYNADTNPGGLPLPIAAGLSKNLSLPPITQIPGRELTVTFTFSNSADGNTQTAQTTVTLTQGQDTRLNLILQKNHEVIIAP